MQMAGATWTMLIDAEDGELEAPSGVALADEVLYVTDNATSNITAFGLDGERLDWLDLDASAGSLMGLRMGDNGSLFVVDNLDERVLEISANEDDDDE